jgi:hypothetical protein
MINDQEILGRLLDIERRLSATPTRFSKSIGGENVQIVEGFAMSDIEAATGGPTTFTMSVYDKNNPDKEWQSSGEVTVTNRDPTLAQSIQNCDNPVFVQARKAADEWRPIWVGCPKCTGSGSGSGS